MRPTRRLAAEALPVVLALLLVACGGSESVETTTTTIGRSTTTTMVTTTTEAPATTAAPATTSSPGPTAGDLPTELGGGTYLVGTEIRPGPWVADECGCPWALVDAEGTEEMGTGDDAIVPEDAYAVRLGGCTWTWDG